MQVEDCIWERVFVAEGSASLSVNTLLLYLSGIVGEGTVDWWPGLSAIVGDCQFWFVGLVQSHLPCVLRAGRCLRGSGWGRMGEIGDSLGADRGRW